jgi:hypothetical protein
MACHRCFFGSKPTPIKREIYTLKVGKTVDDDIFLGIC